MKKAKQRKRKCHVAARQSGLNADKLIEIEAKRDCDQAVKDAKAHYENKIVEQTKVDPKRFWNYTRHYTRSSSTIDVLEHEG